MTEEETDGTKEFVEQSVQSAVLHNLMMTQCISLSVQQTVQEILAAYSIKVADLINRCDTMEDVREVMIGLDTIGTMRQSTPYESVQ